MLLSHRAEKLYIINFFASLQYSRLNLELRRKTVSWEWCKNKYLSGGRCSSLGKAGVARKVGLNLLLTSLIY